MSFTIPCYDVWPIVIPDEAFPGVGGKQFYVAAPDGNNYDTFPTIQGAIDQAVADGNVDNLNPCVIWVEGGTYSESIVLAAGIYLMAAPGGGARLLDCAITCAPGSTTSVSGFLVEEDGNVFGPTFDFTGATQFGLYDIVARGSTAAFPLLVTDGVFRIDDCDILWGAPTAIQIGGGGLFIGTRTIANSLVENNGTGGNPCVVVGSASRITIIDSSITSFIGGGIQILAGGENDTSCSVFGCTVSVIGGANAPGIDIQSGAGLTISRTTFFVNRNGGTNSAINGVLGSSLVWGDLTFGPAADNWTNRVATTTIGAGAQHMVVDSITAF